jgi:hypothetical protein
MIRLISFRDYALGRTLATSYHKHNYITEGNVVLLFYLSGSIESSVFCLYVVETESLVEMTP